MKICKSFHLLDRILDAYADALGDQFQPYKNHVYRVVNFCLAFRECDEVETEKIIIAGCFHDLGIWTSHTFDYLEPSVALARTYLDQNGKTEWVEEIGRMIDMHHRLRKVAANESPLVEVFRKGDWVDASLGLRRFGLPREDFREVCRVFPNLGFHKNLVKLAKRQIKTHPLNPLPMMKW